MLGARRRQVNAIGKLDSLAKVANNDDVAVYVAAHHGQLLSVLRPCKSADVFSRREMGHLARRTTGDGLLPEVSRPVAGQPVLERCAVGGPAQVGCADGQRKDFVLTPSSLRITPANNPNTPLTSSW